MILVVGWGETSVGANPGGSEGAAMSGNTSPRDRSS